MNGKKSALLGLFAIVSPLGAQEKMSGASIEEMAIAARDVGEVLGVHLHRFHVLLPAPHYYRVHFFHRALGQREPYHLLEASSEKIGEMECKISLLDRATLARLLSAEKSEKKLSRDWEWEVVTPSLRWSWSDASPFGKKQKGDVVLSWHLAPSQIFKKITLGEVIPLVIQAGPYVEGGAKPPALDTLPDVYREALAYFMIGIEFSAEPFDERKAEQSEGESTPPRDDER